MDTQSVYRNSLYEHTLHPRVECFSTLREAVLPYPVLQAHQTHSDNVAVVSDRSMVRDDLEGVDALVTGLRDFVIGVRTADCIPVLMFDPVRKVAAAVHSGWKGTVRMISSRTLEVMKERFGSDPSDVLACIGPGIGPDSFQVGPEVVDVFISAGFPESLVEVRGAKVPGTMEGGLHLDLWEANRWILEKSGVLSGSISVCGIDTYSHIDMFYSARREGVTCGRIINSIRII